MTKSYYFDVSDRAGSALWEEIHMPRDFRGAGWQRRDGLADDGSQERGREGMDRQWYQEVDHKRTVRLLICS